MSPGLKYHFQLYWDKQQQKYSLFLCEADEQNFSNLPNCPTLDLKDHLKGKHNIPNDHILFLMGGECDDFSCRTMYGMGINPGSSAIHELLTAFFSFTQGFLDAELGQECSPDQARTTQLKKDAKAALDGQDFTIIVATPYGNDLQWKARFDEFYRQDQRKIKMSQAIVLKDFDATLIEGSSPPRSTLGTIGPSNPTTHQHLNLSFSSVLFST